MAGRQCNRCSQVKPEEEFHLRETGKRRCECKACNRVYHKQRYLANRDKLCANMRKRYDGAAQHISKLQRLYAVDGAMFKAMLEKQRWKCVICKRAETKTYRGKIRNLSIDHDHVSGAMRGLVCGNCNTVLGYSHDSREILLACVSYLEQHSEQPEYCI